MKFTASSSELQRALTTVAGAVPTKSTLPILQCILFEHAPEESSLKLSATDLEISIIQGVSVDFSDSDSDPPARIAVPAKRLLDTLRALPELPIQFHADEAFNVTLRTDQGVYKMVGHDGTDYPALPDLTDKQRIESDGGLLRRAIQKTSFAVSKDALRPAMMGIYFQLNEQEGRAVATDGHRLVKLSLSKMTSDGELSFIVPEKALGLTARIASDDPCTILVDDNYVCFDFPQARVLARLIDETYPNYEAVIPKDNDKRLVVNRMSLLSAVKRVGLYSSTMTNQIRLALQDNEIIVSAEDLERSSEAKETVRCEYESDPMVIGFNAVYLNEVLSNLGGDEVVFDFSSPNRAGVVTPEEQQPDEHVLMLIMPVMLNTYA